MPQITIQGIVFDLPDRYQEGHSLTPGEAHALNQVLRENIRNNFAGQARAAKEAAVPEDSIQQMFRDYVENYEFSDRSSPRSATTTIHSLRRQLAQEWCQNYLKQKGGQTWDDLTKDNQEVMIATAIDRIPAIKEEAQRRYDALNAVIADVMAEEADGFNG
jgi:hypothetical protein